MVWIRGRLRAAGWWPGNRPSRGRKSCLSEDTSPAPRKHRLLPFLFSRVAVEDKSGGCFLGSAVLRRASSSVVVDDDESRRGRLLALLTHGGLPRRLGKHSGGVKVVDPGLEEAGSQTQSQDLLRLQLQLVLALAHPGEGAGHVCRLGAETHA